MAQRFAAWRDRVLGPLRDLLGRLSSSQRLSLAVLGVVVFVGVSLLVFMMPTEPMLPLANLADHPEVLDLVEAQGIPHQVDERRWLRVPAKHLGELRRMGVEEMLANPDQDLYQWLYDQAGWQETAGRRRDRMLRTQIVDLERTLAATSHIKKAKIHIHKPPTDDWTFRANQRQATASVVVVPEPPHQALTPKQALVIAKVVCGAFNIPQNQVVVTDGSQPYDLSDPSALFEGDRYNREKVIEEKIRSLYGNFTPAELRVSVNLLVTHESRVTRLTTFDQDKSFSQPTQRTAEERRTNQPAANDPGTGRNVRSELNRGTVGLTPASFDVYTREEERMTPALSKEETDIRSPAYQEKGANIVVLFSHPAVADRLRASVAPAAAAGTDGAPESAQAAAAPAEADMRRYFDRQRTLLQSLFGTQTGAVEVDSFIPAPSPFTAQDETAGVTVFLLAHLREILLALLALVGCFLIYRIAVGGVPEIEELPDPVADLSRFLEEREAALRAVQEAQEQPADDAAPPWAASPVDQQSMELLEAVVGFVRERPETTASVVRLWMHSDDKSEKGAQQS